MIDKPLLHKIIEPAISFPVQRRAFKYMKPLEKQEDVGSYYNIATVELYYHKYPKTSFRVLCSHGTSEGIVPYCPHCYLGAERHKLIMSMYYNETTKQYFLNKHNHDIVTTEYRDFLWLAVGFSPYYYFPFMPESFVAVPGVSIDLLLGWEYRLKDVILLYNEYWETYGL